VLERLILLKSKKYSCAADLREALKNNADLRNEVNALSRYFLGRSVSGCSNCFFDAYMELINFKNMEKSKFQIRRGAVLYDPINKDVSKILTAANCTDELALYHLKLNPNSRKYFSELPDNVDELIEKFKTGTKTTKPSKQGKQPPNPESAEMKSDDESRNPATGKEAIEAESSAKVKE
jgi:hypothetical protein